MLIKFLWAIIMLVLGLLTINNYFIVFPGLVVFENNILMPFTGLALIIASFVIFLQRVLLNLHKKF